MIDQNTHQHRTFILPIRVYYEDTDAGGVVYHSNYINFFERARTEWLRQLGYELDELVRDEQTVFVVRAVTCEYLRPALFNDELFVSAEIREMGKTSIQFEQKVMRASKGVDKTSDDYITLAQGIVTVVSVDSNKFRPKRLPKGLFEVIKEISEN
jgi:acyl-CoA thioester hydrolase